MWYVICDNIICDMSYVICDNVICDPRSWAGIYAVKMLCYLKVEFEQRIEVNRAMFWENRWHLVLLLTSIRQIKTRDHVPACPACLPACSPTVPRHWRHLPLRKIEIHPNGHVSFCETWTVGAVSKHTEKGAVRKENANLWAHREN